MAARIDTTSLPAAANDPQLFLHPLTAQAIVRLAHLTEEMAVRLDVMCSFATPGKVVPQARELVAAMIDFLDDFAGDLEAEPVELLEGADGDECDAEPGM